MIYLKIDTETKEILKRFGVKDEDVLAFSNAILPKMVEVPTCPIAADRDKAKPIAVNTNARARVELTEEGLFNVKRNPYGKVTNHEGRDFMEGCLWEIMHVFGRGMYNGAPIQLMRNEVEIWPGSE